MKSFLSVASAVFIAVFAQAQNPYAGTWNGKLSAGQMALTIVFHISEDENGDLVCLMDSPDQGVRGIGAEAQVENSLALSVKIPSIGAVYKGLLLNNTIAGTFSQMGQDFPLTLQKGEETLRRPQTPVAPFPYTEEEVIFSNEKAGAVFSGTLVIPERACADTPVILMVSGSGLQDRNEEVFDHKPFLVIADYLARRGIATLRYDDRSFGESCGGDVKNATTLDFYEDAKAGMEYLKSRGVFGRIGVLGHSEGASIAFMLGASGNADFVISLAGTGVKGDEALTAQANRVMQLRGMEQQLTVSDYRTSVIPQMNKWLQWFLDYDPVPDIESCVCPVFAANGDKDVQIISALNLTSIRRHLPSKPSNFCKEYHSLNHLFQHCATGDVTEYRTIEETFSEEVLSDLAEWIAAYVLCRDF